MGSFKFYVGFSIHGVPTICKLCPFPQASSPLHQLGNKPPLTHTYSFELGVRCDSTHLLEIFFLYLRTGLQDPLNNCMQLLCDFVAAEAMPRV